MRRCGGSWGSLGKRIRATALAARRLSRKGKPLRRRRTRRLEASHVVPEEGRARLFRRPRHLDHPQVAEDRVRLRGRHLHRRSRPGRGARPGAKEGRLPRGAPENIYIDDLREEFVRDFVFPMFRANADLRGPLPARHLHRPPADRQAPGGDRRRRRRRRRRPRRHRQGQRPGPLRARRLRAEPVHHASSPPGASGT